MRTLGRMTLIAAVVGVATAVSGTGRVTVPLVVGGALLWSVLPALQLISGVILLRRADAAALDAYFRTHKAWSLWLVAFAILMLLLPDPGAAVVYLAATAFVPLVLTSRALFDVCLRSLGLSPAAARRRVAVHQGITYAAIIAYVDFAAGLWPRLAGAFA